MEMTKYKVFYDEDLNFIQPLDGITIWILTKKSYPFLIRFKDTLQTFEKERVFSLKEEQNNFEIGHLALRYLLSQYSSQKMEEVCLSIHKEGKYYWKDSNIYFNISHSSNYVALVFSNKGEVGIDIETIVDQTLIPHIIGITFSSQEIENYTRNSSLLTFYEIWTFKEAYCKRQGKGLDNQLKYINYYDFKDSMIQFHTKEYVVTVIY